MALGPLRRVHVFRGWWIVFTAFLSQIGSGAASGWVFGVLILPMQGDLGWSRSTIVGVITVEKLVAGAFGVWLGPRLDRQGARLIMTVSAFVAGACLIGNAFVNAPWQSYLLWAIAGLTVPGLQTMGPVVAISNWFVRKRSKAIMFATLSSAVSGLILAPSMATVAESMSWRVSWVLMGLLMWVIVPLAWALIRRRPEDLGLTPDGELPSEARLETGPRLTEESDAEEHDARIDRPERCWHCEEQDADAIDERVGHQRSVHAETLDGEAPDEAPGKDADAVDAHGRRAFLDRVTPALHERRHVDEDR